MRSQALAVHERMHVGEDEGYNGLPFSPVCGDLKQICKHGVKPAQCKQCKGNPSLHGSARYQLSPSCLPPSTPCLPPFSPSKHSPAANTPLLPFCHPNIHCTLHSDQSMCGGSPRGGSPRGGRKSTPKRQVLSENDRPNRRSSPLRLNTSSPRGSSSALALSPDPDMSASLGSVRNRSYR